MKKIRLLLSATLLFTACGGPDDFSIKEDQVSGGTPTGRYNSIGAFIGTNDDGQFICTAFQIANNHVITAAHCVWGITSGFYTQDATITDADASGVVDAADVASFHNATQWDVPAAYTTTRNDPDHTTGQLLGNDIAVVRLGTRPNPPQSPVAPTDRPILLADGPPPAGTAIRIVGYGDTENGSDSGTKRTNTNTINAVRADMIDYRDVTGCGGDSGGPVFTELTGRPVVVAVHVSRRDTAGGDIQCGGNTTLGSGPRIDVHLAWIQGLVNGTQTCNACGGRQCGTGACGWNCGTCTGNATCTAGQCIAACPTDEWGASFCSAACPCSAGQGDCDRDSDCQAGLVCANNVGPNYGQASWLDVCQAPGSVCPPASGLWGASFCSPQCPCSDGQGDCDRDSDCGAGLVCASNVGASYGQASWLDVCEAPGPVCPPASAVHGWSFCSVECPCSHGQGDCDGDAQCVAGTVCVNDVGLEYGAASSGIDVCVTEQQQTRTWNPAADFRMAPNNANPNPDQHGNSTTWLFSSGSRDYLTTSAGSRQLSYYQTVGGGREQWADASASPGAPFVRKDRADDTTLTIAPGAPGSDLEIAGIAWRVPSDGRYRVRVTLRDVQSSSCATCDGVEFRLVRAATGAAGTRTRLVSGTVPEGGSRNIDYNVTAATHDRIWIFIAPNASNSFDYTSVRFDVEEL